MAVSPGTCFLPLYTAHVSDGAQPRIALVSCRQPTEVDEDEPLLLGHLAAAGVDGRVCGWDDPAVDWAQFSVVVVRSSWNYHHDLPAFLGWVDRVQTQTRLLNPAPVLRWNADKRYLLDLAAADVPTLPTQRLRVDGSSVVELATTALAQWPDLVVKPAVSAGSFGTLRVGAGDQAALVQHLARWDGKDILLQPFEPAVLDAGEHCLTWIDGTFTHCVRKGARFEGDPAAIEAVPVVADESAFAARALAAAPGPCLYARVGFVRTSSGLRLMELELIEPSLFLPQAPDPDRAAALFAAAIQRQAAASSRRP